MSSPIGLADSADMDLMGVCRYRPLAVGEKQNGQSATFPSCSPSQLKAAPWAASRGGVMG